MAHNFIISLSVVSVKRLAKILGNPKTFQMVKTANAHYFDKFVGPVTTTVINPEAPQPNGLVDLGGEQFRLASRASLAKFKATNEAYGWDLNAVDPHNGRTVLWIGVQKSKISLVRYLLSKKVNVNIADSNGITPLAKSIMVNNIRIETMLLSHDANPNLGQTVYM